MYEYAAWGDSSGRDVLGVVDGDTLHVGVDLGLDISTHITLRLYGINAPEMGTAEGVAAKQWALEWFQTNCPDGTFTVNTIKDKREKYGRYLAVVTAPNLRVYNADIVTAGHAVEYYPR